VKVGRTDYLNILDRQKLNPMTSSAEFTSYRRSIYVQLRTTSLGVLMNASLALLAINVFNAFKDPNQQELWAEIARGISSFIVIIWVIMEYISYSMIQDRYPTWIDTVQLHLLGVAQIACSVYVGDSDYWFWSSIAMALLGIWAYAWQYPRKPDDLIFPELQPTVILNLCIAFACCLGSLVALIAYHCKIFGKIALTNVHGANITLHDVLLVLPYILICYFLALNTARVKKMIISTLRQNADSPKAP